MEQYHYECQLGLAYSLEKVCNKYYIIRIKNKTEEEFDKGSKREDYVNIVDNFFLLLKSLKVIKIRYLRNDLLTSSKFGRMYSHCRSYHNSPIQSSPNTWGNQSGPSAMTL